MSLAFGEPHYHEPLRTTRKNWPLLLFCLQGLSPARTTLFIPAIPGQRPILYGLPGQEGGQAMTTETVIKHRGMSLGPVALKVIEARTARPCVSIGTLARDLGVSRQRVSQILHAHSMPGPRPKTRCGRCGAPIRSRDRSQVRDGNHIVRSTFCHQCAKDMHFVPLICDQCGKLFYRYKSSVMHDITVRHRQWFFCSPSCRSRHYWAGRRIPPAPPIPEASTTPGPSAST